jgi:hypothetical protein
VGDKRKHQAKGAPRKETHREEIYPQDKHAKAWCSKGINCEYKWECKFKHCGYDGEIWHKKGFKKTQLQIESYRDAMKNGMNESPYYRPISASLPSDPNYPDRPRSPDRRSTARRNTQAGPPPEQQRSKAKEKEQNRIKERLSELQKTIADASHRLSNHSLTTAERYEIVAELQSATREIEKLQMDNEKNN